MAKADKRSKKRVSVNIKVDYQSDGHFLFERASNLSEHGIFIQTEKPLPMGTEVQLKFALPDSQQNISALGEVVWVNQPSKNQVSSDYGMGVRFLSLSDLDREVLLATIKRLAVL